MRLWARDTQKSYYAAALVSGLAAGWDTRKARYNEDNRIIGFSYSASSCSQSPILRAHSNEVLVVGQSQNQSDGLDWRGARCHRRCVPFHRRDGNVVEWRRLDFFSTLHSFAEKL